MAQAAAAGINPKVVVWDGAYGNQTFAKWDPYLVPVPACDFGPTNPWCNYDRVRSDLTAKGFSENQVQAIWLKDANSVPHCSLNRVYCAQGYVGDPDAFIAERYLGDIVRALHARYPHLQQVFISSRIYGGYANAINSCLNPEPFAFEYGITVQRLILAQIYQASHNGAGNGDPYPGSINYVNYGPPGIPPTASWIDWGPYLWANGNNPRGDNQLIWCNDPKGIGPPPCKGHAHFRYGDDTHIGDLTHPSTEGEQVVGGLLLTFMQQNRLTTTSWFWP
ncbi:MAG TPA: hypothetical protein VFA68_17925 [Terriglobales bacterium]|nr:hypothetical protein [Terriglobales bacterium]